MIDPILPRGAYRFGIGLYVVNKDFCKKVIPIFDTWSLWSSCSKKCGGGSRTRVRTCKSNCQRITMADTSEIDFCNTDRCTCGELFPFGYDSFGTKSIIDHLYWNSNYRTRITADGE